MKNIIVNLQRDKDEKEIQLENLHKAIAKAEVEIVKLTNCIPAVCAQIKSLEKALQTLIKEERK